jgi:hypothetical protein
MAHKTRIMYIEQKGEDIVGPASKRYGQIITTLPVGVANTVPHHTEHEMPSGGNLMKGNEEDEHYYASR